ncbi:MAG TPA: rhodanese-like domain-containing protein [Allocoleopsis sp.]
MLNFRLNRFNPTFSEGYASKISSVPLGNHRLRSPVPQIDVQELQQLLDTQASNLVAIDVRYESEYNIAHLPGWTLIPYPEIQQGQGIAKIQHLLEEKRRFNPGREPHLIVMCKAGVRSAKALALLEEVGITGTNVTGGIDAWSQQIDPSIPQYSMKDIAEANKSSVKSPKSTSQLQRWLYGGGIVLALGTVGAVLAVRQHPDRIRPLIQAGVPLQWASNLPVIGYTVQQASYPQITVQQLKQLIDRKTTDYLLVDVRSPKEYQKSHIPGAVLVPIEDIEQGSGINKIRSSLHGRRLIAYCTSGARSDRALVLLREAGIVGTQVKGGITAWSEQIDPSVSYH